MQVTKRAGSKSYRLEAIDSHSKFKTWLPVGSRKRESDSDPLLKLNCHIWQKILCEPPIIIQPMKGSVDFYQPSYGVFSQSWISIRYLT